MIEIRVATYDQAEVISKLGSNTFTETFGMLFTDPRDVVEYCERTFSIEKIAASLTSKNNIFWVAYVNELPVGYAKLKLNSTSGFIDSTNICQLQKIYVLAEFHSMQIGRSLQDAVLRKAQSLQNEVIWLSVYDNNLKAITFYKKNGFESVGKHTFTIGKDTFNFQVMRKYF